MKTGKQEYGTLPDEILSALSMLDEKGTNDSVTMSMSIVYEAFKRHASKGNIAASELLRSAKLYMTAEI